MEGRLRPPAKFDRVRTVYLAKFDRVHMGYWGSWLDTRI